MIKYQIKDENDNILFPSLTTYELIDKHDIWFGATTSDISEVISNFAVDGFIVSKIIDKKDMLKTLEYGEIQILNNKPATNNCVMIDLIEDCEGNYYEIYRYTTFGNVQIIAILSND